MKQCLPSSEVFCVVINSGNNSLVFLQFLDCFIWTDRISSPHMLWMFSLHSAAYWLCMPVRAFIMISSFSGVKRYFVKRKNILLCLDKKTWRCGQRFWGLKPMLRSAAAICAPEPTHNVILRQRHRPRESRRKSSTLWFTIFATLLSDHAGWNLSQRKQRHQVLYPKQHRQNRDDLLHRNAVHNLACNAKQTDHSVSSC